MDTRIKGKFIQLWSKYFNGAELPIALYYTDQEGRAELAEPPSEHRCLICDLGRVRKGQPLSFTADTIGCTGGER